MGYPMAMNVRRKMSPNGTLYINDVHHPFCEKFLEEFGTTGTIVIVETAKEVAEKADTIISIVPAAEHVKAVYLNKDNGIIAASKRPGRLMLECSTIDSQTTREVGEALGKAEAGEYVDTPVSVCCTIPSHRSRN